MASESLIEQTENRHWLDAARWNIVLACQDCKKKASQGNNSIKQP